MAVILDELMFFVKKLKLKRFLKEKKRVVLIGNAPIKKSKYYKKALSDFIDDSDVVIRINSADNYSKGTGKKCDILGILNIGDPAIEYAYRREINKHVKEKLSSVWFSRPLDLYSSSKILVEEDLSEYILSFQKLYNIPSHAIPKEQYQYLCKKISPANSGNMVDPSSGFCFLHMMLSAEEFKGLKKVLVGFSWEGWTGHNWELEKKICLDLHNNGDIYIL